MLLYLFLVCSTLLRCNAATENQARLVDHLLQVDHRDVKPADKVDVQVNLFLRAILDVDTTKHSITSQITFRQSWIDERLQYNATEYGIKEFVTLTDGADMFWTPDTFFRNAMEVHVHKGLGNNQYVRVYPDGRILYSARLTVKSMCAMDLRDFPFDSQKCLLHIASYGFRKSELEYVWMTPNPVQMPRNLMLPDFALTDFAATTVDVMTATGEYNAAEVSFDLSRASSPYVLTVFTPINMFVVVGWLSVFVQCGNGRLLLTLFALLAFLLNSLMALIYRPLPTVAYTKACDVYSGTSTLFIFILIAAAVAESNKVDVNLTEKNAALALIGSRWWTLALRIGFPVSWILFNILFFASYV